MKCLGEDYGGEKHKICSNLAHAPLLKELAVAVAGNGNSYKSNSLL